MIKYLKKTRVLGWLLSFKNSIVLVQKQYTKYFNNIPVLLCFATLLDKKTWVVFSKRRMLGRFNALNCPSNT
jgi:hypothetical protein